MASRWTPLKLAIARMPDFQRFREVDYMKYVLSLVAPVSENFTESLTEPGCLEQIQGLLLIVAKSSSCPKIS